MKYKAKQPKQKRNRLAKIAKAESLREKLYLSRTGMTEKEYNARAMVLARDFFKLRHVDPKELDGRARREARGGEVSLRTEREFNCMLSAQKRAWQVMWVAMHKWKPELLEELARSMRKHARHKFPQSSDAQRHGALISNDGNVDAALAVRTSSHPDLDPLNERRNLNRLKKVLFP